MLSPAAAAVFLVTAASVAVAQQPPKAAPATPAAPANPAAQGQQPQQPQFIYSPWTKFCPKPKDPNAKGGCITGKDARTESGIPVVAAGLIEPEGGPKNVLRLTVPGGVHLQYGTRMIIDQQEPVTAQFLTCVQNQCIADIEATPELIQKMSKGQMMVVQAINMAGSAISFPLPLTDFAKAHDGPPTDPKVFEEQQKKLQQELQKRAEEARKKLQSQGGQAPATR
ncbi:MAG: invasion associated locus B family protein [Xanthobacteraceae bacterium]